MTIFDDALLKRFDDSPTISAIEVSATDTLLIRVTETGTMRLPVSVLLDMLGDNFASLVDGKVPESQLPSYVDDVLEYANLAAFPATGETGKIYIALDTNLVYRWSGSVYVVLPISLALGETSTTAYRGDRGKVAYDHTFDTAGNPHNIDSKANIALEAISTPTLLNGWVNYDSTYSQAGYYKDNFGIVHLTGTVKDGPSGNIIFILPSGYRPSKITQFFCATGAVIFINTSGEVTYSSGSKTNLSLDGIYFRP